MLRAIVGVIASCVFVNAPLLAQDKYPIAVGLGLGINGERVDQWYHGMALVVVTPPRSPISLRLDGVVAKQGEHMPVASALSASAVIALRPWRVAPYLVVGASRTYTGAYTYRSAPWLTIPDREKTELTGGFGLSARFRTGRAFVEMRSLGQVGAPLSIGFSF